MMAGASAVNSDHEDEAHSLNEAESMLERARVSDDGGTDIIELDYVH